MGKFCTSCGSQLLPNSLFCGECGAKNEHNVGAAPAPKATKPAYTPPRPAPAPVKQPPAPRYQPQYEDQYANQYTSQDDSAYTGTPNLGYNYNQSYNYNYSQDDTNYAQGYGAQPQTFKPPARAEAPAKSQASSGGWAPPPPPVRTVPPPPAARSPQPGSSPSSGTMWSAKSSKAPPPPPASERPTGTFAAAKPQPTPEDEEKKKADEKKKAEDRRAREKEMQKREEEYTKNRESSKQIEQFKEKQRRTSMMMKNLDPANCYCEMHVVQYEVKKKSSGKPDFVAFKVEVIFEGSEWAIWRRWKQFTEIDGVFKSQVRGYQPCLPNIDKNQYGSKFDPQLSEARMNGLETYMTIIANARPAIFESKVAAAKFFQFIAPVQYGDVKPLGFIMPFKVIPC